MKKLSASDPAVFEFSFPQKDTLVRIEHDAGGDYLRRPSCGSRIAMERLERGERAAWRPRP